MIQIAKNEGINATIQAKLETDKAIKGRQVIAEDVMADENIVRRKFACPSAYLFVSDEAVLLPCGEVLGDETPDFGGVGKSVGLDVNDVIVLKMFT